MLRTEVACRAPKQSVRSLTPTIGAGHFGRGIGCVVGKNLEGWVLYSYSYGVVLHSNVAHTMIAPGVGATLEHGTFRKG